MTSNKSDIAVVTDSNSSTKVEDNLRNIYNRTLRNQIAIHDALHDGIDVEMAKCKWHLSIDQDGRMLANTTGNDKLVRTMLSNYAVLDGLTMKLAGGNAKNVFSLRVKRSIVTKINILGPSEATIIELTNDAYDSKKAMRLRAIIDYSQTMAPIMFSCYFAHWTKSDESRLCAHVGCDGGGELLNGIRFTFNGVDYIVYNYNRHGNDGQDARKHIVVEALGRIKYDEFCAAVRRILLVLGFFSSSYAFGSLMVFDADGEDRIDGGFIAHNECMSKPCNALLPLFTTNAYSCFTDADLTKIGNKSNHVGEADSGETKNEETTDIETMVHELANQLIPIERPQFEKLLELLEDDQFEMMFYTLHEASISSHPMTATSRLVQYAACLEMLSSWAKNRIASQTTKRTTLLSDKNRKYLLRTFRGAIKAIDDEATDKEILLNKLNGGFFCIPNSEELENPFYVVGLEPTDEDKNCLRERNFILHGKNIISEKFDEANVSAYIDECESKCFAFYSLIWRIIMKAIGYRGTVFHDVATHNSLRRRQQSNGGKPIVKSISQPMASAN